MSRPARIFVRIVAGLAALLVVLVIAAVLVVRTQWFRDFVRGKIVSYAEDATGGKVDIGSFGFDWTRLHADVRDFVLHGTEGAGQAPLFQAKDIDLVLRLLPSFSHTMELESLSVDQPRANVIVYPDGHTNVPSPKTKPTSNKTVLEDVVDLAIGRFNIQNGSATFADHKVNFQAQGENLRAQLSFNTASEAYDGRLGMRPFYLEYQGNQRLGLDVTLPVHFERDKIQLTNAKITSPDSEVVVSGSMQHLADLQTSAQVNARIALDEVKRVAGASIPLDLRRNAPKDVTADVALSMDKDHIQISRARMNLGESSVEASGKLKDPAGNGSLRFNARLALGQIGRMLNVSAQPDGTVQIGGDAKLIDNSGYSVDGNIAARNVSFREGGTEFKNIALVSGIKANQSMVELNGLKVSALGGELRGAASLAEMQRLRFSGDLSNFDLNQLARTVGNQKLAYAGVLSGKVQADDDLKAKGTSGIQARADLAISPGRNGTPLSGRLNVVYNGRTGAIDVGNSYLALPSSRLDLSGSLNQRIQFNLVSHNLNDFLPALAMTSTSPPAEMPLELRQGGSASFAGSVTGNLSSPRILGHVAVQGFHVDGRSFDQMSANVSASSSGASVENAALTAGSLEARLAANIGLHQWKPESNEPVNATAQIQNADLADILALAGQKIDSVSGALNADARISGTIGNPQGTANLNIANGAAYDYRFDQLAANINFSDQLVRIVNAQLSAGSAHASLTGTYQHAKDSMETGRVQLQITSNQMSLDQFQARSKTAPALGGTVQMNAAVTGDLQKNKDKEEFRLASLNADVSARGIRYEGENYGDLTATAQTNGTNIDYRLNSDFAGSTIRANGQTRLAPEYPTTANLGISGLPLERVIAITGRKDIPLAGRVSADAQVSGTISNPSGTATFALTNGTVYEHVDSLQGQIRYSERQVEIPSLRVASGAARIEVAGQFDHPPNDFKAGSFQVSVKTNQVQLAQFKKIQEVKPGLAGAVEIDISGAGNLQNASGKPPILLTRLNGNAAATRLRLNNQPFGDARLTAETRGSELNFDLNSDFANSRIQGNGRMQLSGDYPINAQVSFANVTYAGVRNWIGAAESSPLTQPQVDGTVEGTASISGPVLKPEELSASLRIPTLNLSATPRAGQAEGPRVTLQNQGPIVASLSRSLIRIDSAHITGPNTDISVSGTAQIQGNQQVSVDVNAKTDLSLVKSFDRNVYSSGQVSLQAAVRGKISDPQINGELRLDNAAFNMIDAPNGISNANGVISFAGNTATIQSLTAESGGGKVSAAGTASYTGGIATFQLSAKADNVRVRYPESVSTLANAAITLNGNSQSSTLAGTVTVLRIQFSPQSDFGSILSSTAPPIQAPPDPNGLLANMHLQVEVKTTPGVQFQTALAQNIEAVADLRVRGTAAEPGVLGRINITQGQLVFFGTKYTVNQGSVAFYNPLQIEPVLDIDLQTNVQGVDITLNVSGPIDNLKLTHRSDPPLPFNEVLALLAAGKTPEDPTIAANQPVAPPQSLQNMGESAILQQAIANPVSSRLQRVFGITEFKITPAFVTGSVVPQARMTLEQQVSNNIDFTYITDLSNANTQIFQIEWAMTPQWSAVATRDENGLFGLDFYYNKKFK